MNSLFHTKIIELSTASVIPKPSAILIGTPITITWNWGMVFIITPKIISINRLSAIIGNDILKPTINRFLTAPIKYCAIPSLNINVPSGTAFIYSSINRSIIWWPSNDKRTVIATRFKKLLITVDCVPLTGSNIAALDNPIANDIFSPAKESISNVIFNKILAKNPVITSFKEDIIIFDIVTSKL